MSTAAAAPSTSVLTDEQVDQYRREGYVILPRAIPEDLLALLRGGCAAAMAATDAEMDAQGTDVLGLNRRGNRYFSGQPSLKDPGLFRFIFSPLMEDVCRRLLGESAHVFYEQYVVKGPETGMSFSWHQDSGYVSADTPHLPYLT